MSNPIIGKQAPTFSLPNYDGQTYEFKPGNGVPTALFFYPSSGTYGCTKEACAFRDAIAEKGVFKSKVNVVGVSSNPVAKQKEFVEKYNLTYPVLSDAKGEARKAYGTSKGLLGLTDSRTTFIIDSKGIVRDLFDSVINYAGHTKFVEKWLDKLQAEEQTGKPATPLAADAIPNESENGAQSPGVPEARTEEVKEESKAAAAVQA
ncbi:AhpC-TSA-domain-containing protein [Cristinia sonorae]|uniref:thioredoxin-dependent peroxiredoxin n=1 Tax=Cristinia sonorae TaxID=1940300 RepID=A0A8K0UVK4_9AGAR|nr:AhpC-TSA-domain-containing protein [Cristinia sonorae]